MKTISYILILLLLVNVALALDECKQVITVKEVPCIIKSTWAYPDCNTTEIVVYNSTPEIQFIANFTEYGDTGRCNITWNISTIGSYFYNVSNGDSGTIIVQQEVDEMASWSIMFFMMVITGAIFWIGIAKQFTNNEVANHIIKKCIYLCGIWMLVFTVTVALNIVIDYGLGVEDIMYQLLWFTHFGAYIFTIVLMWTAVQGGLTLYKVKQVKRRMGYE